MPPPEDIYGDLFTEEGAGEGILFLQVEEVSCTQIFVAFSLIGGQGNPDSVCLIVQLKRRTAEQQEIIQELRGKVQDLEEEVP